MGFPPINNPSLMIQYLNQWRKSLNKVQQNIFTPQIPWNFTVASQQGGNLLTWARVPLGDGYQVLISASTDFSTGVQVVTLPNVTITSYFDPVSNSGGAAPPKRCYQVRAVNGNIHQPHSVIGNTTQAICSQAIAANDTGTASTSASDSSTDQQSQDNTRNGNYNGHGGNGGNLP